MKMTLFLQLCCTGKCTGVPVPVCGLKKNMKNALMLIRDKLYLRKRALMGTVNDELKNICQIEHTRHRCFANFIANMISASHRL
jgi:hypothetical protein